MRPSRRLLACLAAVLASAGPACAGVVQLDLSGDFNADVVVNDGGGMNDPAQDPIDLGVMASGNFCFPTQSVAEAAAVDPATPNGLPDDGFFPASADHPQVRLAWRNDDDGLNAWRVAGAPGTLDVTVPAGAYVEFHVFATSGDGDALIELTPVHADGPGAAVAYTVPDWFDPPAGTLDEYALVDGLDRMQPGSGPGTLFDYEDSDRTAVFGFRLLLDPTRELVAVKLERTDSSGALSVFGAVAVTEEPLEGCCFPDGSCADLGPGECAAAGGTAQGSGTACLTSTCPEPGLPGWVPDGASRAGEPLRLAKAAGGLVELGWGLGCSPEAVDHVVHEGPIGSWYRHEAVLCDTGGALVSASLVPAPGGRYFLVVPVTDLDEGSYGLDSFGAERPPSGFATCRPTQRLGCP